jgi:hypothetical protein
MDAVMFQSGLAECLGDLASTEKWIGKLPDRRLLRYWRNQQLSGAHWALSSFNTYYQRLTFEIYIQGQVPTESFTP